MDGDGSDGDFCYCSALVNPPLRTCLASPLTDPRMIDMSPLNTDDSPLCMPTMSGGKDYCVIAATTITVNTMLRATGSKPLVLIASDSIQIDNGGVIDVGSHRMPSESIGAGTALDPKFCVPEMPGMPSPPPAADQGGGGAGGSFTGSGGAGGHGAGTGSGPGGTPVTVAMPPTAFRGGCSGQDGGGASPGTGGQGGHGGGAVFLIANNEIHVGGAILAGGEGGGGGLTTEGMTKHSGGGGGGAGGMIGLEAHSISVTGLLVANGGGGGEGAGSPKDYPLNNPNGNGAPGHDATTTAPAAVPACGGSGGTKDAGDGGCGSPGCNTHATCPSNSGSESDGGGSASGGGGGGGGAGLIKVHGSASLGGQVSPPPTP